MIGTRLGILAIYAMLAGCSGTSVIVLNSDGNSIGVENAGNIAQADRLPGTTETEE